MTKKMILGIAIGILLNCLIASAAEKIAVNSLQTVATTNDWKTIQTTKITTPEGTYRIFLYSGYKQGGITAVRINK